MVLEEVVGDREGVLGGEVEVQAVAGVRDEIVGETFGTREEIDSISGGSIAAPRTLSITRLAKDGIQLTVNNLDRARIRRFGGSCENADHFTGRYHISVIPVVLLDRRIKTSSRAEEGFPHKLLDSENQVEGVEMTESIRNRNLSRKKRSYCNLGEILHEVGAPASQDKSVIILGVKLC